MRFTSSLTSASVQVPRKTVMMTNAELVFLHQDEICPGVFYFPLSGRLIYHRVH